MNQTVARCEAAMPLDILSAWHDREAPPDVAQRVRQHVATCQACQTYLAAYEADGRAIRDFAPPPLQDAIWRDVQPVTTQSSSRRLGPSRGVILSGLGAAMAVVLLFVTISVIYLNNHGHSLTVVPTGTPAATATITIAPTATVATLNVSPSQGWVNTPALAFAKDVAFVRNNPLTGYACGNATSALDSIDPVLLSATHDGGLTWSVPLATPLKGADCAMWVNPSNPQDIIASSFIQCYRGCSREDYDRDFVSRDSGTTWSEITLPPNPPSTTYGISQVAWAGEDIFAFARIITGNTATQPFYLLAVSVAKGDFSWIDINKISGGLPESSLGQPGMSFVIGSTFYTQFNYNGCAATNAICPFAMTNDNGATWQHFTPKGDLAGYNQGGPFLDWNIFVGGNGQTLYAQYPGGATTSTDGGKNWVSLSFASVSNLSQIVVTNVAPDGTLYGIILGSNESEDIYMLAPNSSNWIKVASASLVLKTISWRTDGHPIALWARNAPNAKVISPGIDFHAAVAG